MEVFLTQSPAPKCTSDSHGILAGNLRSMCNTRGNRDGLFTQRPPSSFVCGASVRVLTYIYWTLDFADFRKIDFPVAYLYVYPWWERKNRFIYSIGNNVFFYRGNGQKARFAEPSMEPCYRVCCSGVCASTWPTLLDRSTDTYTNTMTHGHVRVQPYVQNSLLFAVCAVSKYITQCSCCDLLLLQHASVRRFYLLFLNACCEEEFWNQRCLWHSP